MDEFAHILETALDRLVVNETTLVGRFDFRVPAHATTFDQMRELLLAHTRLVLTPATREVSLLVVRPA